MRTIAIVDDHLPNALLLKGYVRRIEDTAVQIFTRPTAALEWCMENEPDLIMLDYLMPDMDGAEVLTRLRATESLRDVPVVVITAEESKETLYRVLELGANDFLRKPVDDIELIARVNNMLQLRARQLELAAANERLYTLATTDPLTGLANRRHFIERLGAELERTLRYGRPMCLALIDVDHFKVVNDTYGHDAGDEVLRHLSGLIQSRIRKGDLAGRIGGEEYALLLLETALAGGERAAQRLIEDVARCEAVVGSATIRFTVSVGLTEAWNGGDSVNDILKRADVAMYAAKRLGRNRLEVFGRSDEGQGADTCTAAIDDDPAAAAAPTVISLASARA